MSASIKEIRSTTLFEYAAKRWETLQAWLATPECAYLAILLLQLKRVWGAWQYKDLTYGDTSSYFKSAVAWANELSVTIHWSPLYTAFYGTVFKLIPDVYWATLLHRLLIVFMLAIMVLALMRRLLPAGIAWLLAAWWVILPINFDSLYEVHLFAVLLPLAAVLLVLYQPNRWTRGGALGILLLTTLLVRNEVIIAVGLWILMCVAAEIPQVRLQRRLTLKLNLLAYGWPVLFALMAFSFFYWRTLVKPTPQRLSLKHTANVCQVYAFGYQQRHPEWTKNPWTECRELMERVFGQPLPSMLEALRSNPRAMADHFLWNLRLLPAGLQVALFNATADHVNPDYPPVLLRRFRVMVPTLLAVGLFTLGLAKLYQQKQDWWAEWLRQRVWGWTLLLCLAAVMLVVIPTQRPRPSYMFMLTLLLMAMLGMCLFITLRRLAVYQLLQRWTWVVMLGLLLFTPPYYSAGTRDLLDLYHALYPAKEFVGITGTAIVTPGYAQELCNYFIVDQFGTNTVLVQANRKDKIRYESGTPACVGYSYSIFDDLRKAESVGQFLQRQPLPVVALLIDKNFLAKYGNQPPVQAFLAHPEQAGWKMVPLPTGAAGRQLYLNGKKFDRSDSLSRRRLSSFDTE
jgi:hypothetical protein